MSNILMRNRNTYQSKVAKLKVPRSIFPIKYSRKQTINASYIVPIMCKRVYPGQTLFIDTSIFVRLNTQITCPIDNLQVSSFFFYGPDRIEWDDWKYFIGEEKNPDETIDYLIPQCEIPAEANTAGSLFNYLFSARLGKKLKVSDIPLRLHNDIYNEYFRDSDCGQRKTVNKSSADGTYTDYNLYKIHKSRDYFTNSTRQITKGSPVNIPLGTAAPVIGNGNSIGLNDGTNADKGLYWSSDFGAGTGALNLTVGSSVSGAAGTTISGAKAIGLSTNSDNSGIIADLSNAQGARIAALRNAIFVEEYQEALNRGGTKYVDIMRNIYGVTIPDLTINRPVYLGGTTTPLFTSEVIQTSGTGATGTDTPQGNLAGYGKTTDRGKIINASFQEHGWVIGYICIKAQPQYQQGIDRTFVEKDKYDIFNPFFNNASDQAIYREEIFLEDYDAVDNNGDLLNKKVFGYIGRNDHMRYMKNEICGELNSEYQYTLDSWHYAEKFENAPENNENFMEDKTNEILTRSLAVPYENYDEDNPDNNILAPQFIVDIAYQGATALPIPTHAVPKISALI